MLLMFCPYGMISNLHWSVAYIILYGLRYVFEKSVTWVNAHLFQHVQTLLHTETGLHRNEYIIMLTTHDGGSFTLTLVSIFYCTISARYIYLVYQNRAIHWHPSLICQTAFYSVYSHHPGWLSTLQASIHPTSILQSRFCSGPVKDNWPASLCQKQDLR